MEQKKSLFSAFFSFNLTVICGILIGLFVNAISTEAKPVSTFLFDPTLYIVSSILAVGFRLFWWLTLEKGTMFMKFMMEQRAYIQVHFLQLV